MRNTVISLNILRSTATTVSNDRNQEHDVYLGNKDRSRPAPESATFLWRLASLVHGSYRDYLQQNLH